MYLEVRPNRCEHKRKENVNSHWFCMGFMNIIGGVAGVQKLRISLVIGTN
jgi:hypothetical protein